MVRYDYLKKCVVARFEEHQTCFYFKNDLTKKLECLQSLDQDKVNIDLNNNVSDNDSNIDDSKEEELQFLTGRLTKRMIVIPSWKWCLMNKILK